MNPHSKHSLSALSFMLCAASNILGQTPTFTTINFPNSASTQSWGINGRGDVSGFYTLADKSSHGFLLSGGKYTPIDFPGAAVTLVNGIGPSGNLVGEYGTTLTSPHHGFLLTTDGVFTSLDVPGATTTYAIGIDARGDIMGGYTLADNIAHIFLLSGGQYTTIDYPGATATIGNGMNAQGDIVGGYSLAGVSHGMLYRNGVFTSFDAPGATFTTATGINPAGEIVGRYTSGGVNHGFTLIGGQFTTIDFPNATFTGATSVDAAGNIVGRCTVGGLTEGFLLSKPRVATRYTLTDLGPVGGAPGQPYVMTDNGLLSGAAAMADGSTHAVLWNNGLKADLATPGLGGFNSLALGVNSSGQAVGGAESVTPDPGGEDFCGFQADGLPAQGLRCLPFLWQNGVMNPLPTLGGVNGQASWINNRGDIVGTAENLNLDPACPSPQKYQFKPVIWDNGQIHELPTFGSDRNGYAISINDSGQIAGGSGECSSLQAGGTYLLSQHALLWEEGSITDLGNLGGTGHGMGILPLGINNQGQVVGFSDLSGDQTFHGFLWSRLTGMEDVGTLPSDVASVALAVNDPGEVIGISVDADFNLTAFVRQPGDVLTDLNTLVPADSPLYLFLSCSLNNQGVIAGIGMTQSGDVHAFMATPISGPVGDARSVARPKLSEAARRIAARYMHKRDQTDPSAPVNSR